MGYFLPLFVAIVDFNNKFLHRRLYLCISISFVLVSNEFLEGTYQINRTTVWKMLWTFCVFISFYLNSCHQTVKRIYKKCTQFEFYALLIKNCILGPLNEELIYRKHLVGILKDECNFANQKAILLSSIIFSSAHLLEVLNDVSQRRITKMSLLQCLTTIFITFLFGILSCCICQQLKSLACAVIAHSVCNAFGIPDWFGVGLFSCLLPIHIITYKSLLKHQL